jgi:hypothetical protein
MDAARRQRLLKLADAASLSSIAMPPVVGDIVGLAGDAAGIALDPSRRNALDVGLAAAGVIPFVPSGMSAARRGMTKLDEVFDAEKGIGAVPNQIDLPKKGLGRVEYMTPDEFLGKASFLSQKNIRYDSVDFLQDSIQKGKKLANPWLKVTTDPQLGKPYVAGHEGRHRMLAIKKEFGPDVLVPVQVLGRGEADKQLLSSGRSVKDILSESDAQFQRLMRETDVLLGRSPTVLPPKASVADLANHPKRKLEQELNDIIAGKVKDPVNTMRVPMNPDKVPETDSLGRYIGPAMRNNPSLHERTVQMDVLGSSPEALGFRLADPHVSIEDIGQQPGREFFLNMLSKDAKLEQARRINAMGFQQAKNASTMAKRGLISRKEMMRVQDRVTERAERVREILTERLRELRDRVLPPKTY